MRAVILDSFESPPRLRDDLPIPQPGPGELLVRVYAASINRGDAVVAAGLLKEMMEYDFPVTLGRDYAGVVETVGSAVRRYEPGDEVYGFLPFTNPLHDGSWADYLLVSEETSVGRKPGGVEFAAAGSAPVAALTAIAALDAFDLAPGARVLVLGASGGVGSLFVQLAASAGIEVLATGLSDDDYYLRALGATEVVDRDEDVRMHIHKTYPEGVDALLDLLSREPDTSVLKRDGKVASPIGAAGEGPGRFNLMAEASTSNLDRLGELLDSGKLRIPIQETYPLERAAEALEDVASTHTQGKRALSLA